jgi:hypothetical protein
MFICLSIDQSIYLNPFLYLDLNLYLDTFFLITISSLSIYLSTYLTIYLSTSLSPLYPSLYIRPFLYKYKTYQITISIYYKIIWFKYVIKIWNYKSIEIALYWSIDISYIHLPFYRSSNLWMCDMMTCWSIGIRTGKVMSH